jgi:uncharacterized protein (DUF433 family)
VGRFRQPPPPSTGAKMVWAMNYQDRIVRDPQIVGGEPVLKGTRVTLKTLLASLAEGATTAEILADFPTLSEEDVRAAIAEDWTGCLVVATEQKIRIRRPEPPTEG